LPVLISISYGRAVLS